MKKNPPHEKKPKIWVDAEEGLLKEWAESCSVYRHLHGAAHRKYKRLQLWFSLPVIILSTITGTANFAQASISGPILAYIPIMIGSLNIFAGVLSTISQFLHVGELVESHKNAASGFGKLSRSITTELRLPRHLRSSDGLDFVRSTRTLLDKLIDQSPAIPIKIISDFDKQFEGETFFRPELSEIHSVDIFMDTAPMDVSEVIIQQPTSAIYSSIGNSVHNLREYELATLKESGIVSSIKERFQQQPPFVFRARKSISSSGEERVSDKEEKISEDKDDSFDSCKSSDGKS